MSTRPSPGVTGLQQPAASSRALRIRCSHHFMHGMDCYGRAGYSRGICPYQPLDPVNRTRRVESLQKQDVACDVREHLHHPTPAVCAGYWAAAEGNSRSSISVSHYEQHRGLGARDRGQRRLSFSLKIDKDGEMGVGVGWGLRLTGGEQHPAVAPCGPQDGKTALLGSSREPRAAGKAPARVVRASAQSALLGAGPHKRPGSFFSFPFL